MPPGTQPTPRNFPIRNRIIGALALGVVVVEAAERSGSLITAREAGERGGEVIRWCGMPASTVLATILELEIAGRLTRHHGNRICLVVIR